MASNPDTTLKFFLYDWAGANTALLAWLQPDGVPVVVLAWLVSTLGSYWGAPVAAVAMAWWSRAARDGARSEAVDCQARRFVLSGLIAWVLIWTLKHALDLPRPFEVLALAEPVIGIRESTGSLPSGHSVYIVTLVVALWPLVSRTARSALLTVVLAVGWSRVAQGLHFPADVAAGWILGLGCWALTRRIVVPLARPQPGLVQLSRERLQAAHAHRRAGDLDGAFHLLEQAHVLGQTDLSMHGRVHLCMLRIGAARGDWREVLGQFGRLVAVPIGHLTGRLPLGNTGGANVSAFEPMRWRPDHALEAAAALAGTMLAASRTSVYAWCTLGFTVAGIDLTVKAAVHSGLPYGISIPVTGFFNVVHLWNPGAAFSFLADAGGWQRWFFIGLAFVVCACLLWLLRRPLQRGEGLGYSLIVGGALGNAIDRLVRGGVVDYLDFHWAGVHWPAFNLADIALTLGVLVLIVASIRQHAAGAPAPQKEW